MCSAENTITLQRCVKALIRHDTRWSAAALAVVVLIVGALLPSTGWAQQEVGWTVTPSMAVAEVFDDNIFSRGEGRGRKSDFITRVTPGLQAGYYSIPFTLFAKYDFDAEVYARHTELNDAQLRRRATAQARYLPIRPLTLSLSGAYTRTETPQDLNLTTGIESARRRARSYNASPSFSYEVDPLTSVNGLYSFTNDKRAGGTQTDTHNASIDLKRQFGRQDTWGVGYTYRHYKFNDQEPSPVSDEGSTTTSHVGSLIWSHEFTPLTSVTLHGGARFSEGSTNPEVSATIQHRLQKGRLSFTYARSQTTAIGQGGTIDTESFSASASYQPIRFLSFSVTPSYYRNDRQNDQSDVYSFGLNATYQMTRWLNLVGSYRFSFQDGTLDDTTGGSTSRDILRNVGFLQLVVSYPYRVD